MAKQPKLGSGKRFERLVRKVSGEPGVTDPAGLVAWMGRRAHGAKRMAEMAAAGKRRAAK